MVITAGLFTIYTTYDSFVCFLVFCLSLDRLLLLNAVLTSTSDVFHIDSYVRSALTSRVATSSLASGESCVHYVRLCPTISTDGDGIPGDVAPLPPSMCAYFPPGYTCKRIPQRVIGANAFGAVVDVYTCGELDVLSLRYRLKTVDVPFLVYFFWVSSTGTRTPTPLPWREACMTYTLRSTHSLHLSTLRSFLCLFRIRSNRRVPSSFHGGYTDGNIPQYREGGHNSFENPNNFVPPSQRNPDQILPDKSSLLPLPPAIKKNKNKNKK